MERFPCDFLIGAATAAHQVEGNNIHSDAWAEEQMKHTTYLEPSGAALDHYHRYEEDIRMMAAAGLNAYRFSIEWARIEPEEGLFDNDELEHYRRVIACCRDNGVEPVITLLHFTSPKWLIARGGWEADTTVAYFSRYVRYVMEHLGSELHYVCTINEANMGVEIADIAQRYAQQIQAARQGSNSLQLGFDLEKMMAEQKAAAAECREVFGTEKAETFCKPRTAHGDEIIMQAHTAARAVIRELCPHVKVGLTLSLHDIQAEPTGEENAARKWEQEFSHYLPAIAEDDFLGVQNYTRVRMGAEGALPVPQGAEMTQMNYEYYPDGLANVLRHVAADFHGELLVTENGIATADDSRRQAFIETALAGVQACRAEGVPVNGYFYWSLLDNFEWQRGFSMTFGLVAVDRVTQTRKPKPSLALLGSYRMH